MARLDDLPKASREHLIHLPCPEFESTPAVLGPPLPQRRIAVVSTAGLHLRGDPPFTGFDGEYRVIPGLARAGDLVMSHISANFDRTGFLADLNVVLPLDRLAELAAEGRIGGLADYHYSFMGAADPARMEEAAGRMAELMKLDGVDGVLLVPV